ncbi:mutator protein [Hordeum vulgare]|nr:mutator protein [Hordeum vulgare]
MSTDSEGWRQQMEALIGMSPQEPEVEDGGKKDRVPAGAPFTWIAANFARCPEDADDEVIQRYAHVYMWYVISRTIFADGTGRNAPWMWLKALTVFDHKFSWGSAALAYLYRQGLQRTVEFGGLYAPTFSMELGTPYLLDALKAHSGIPRMTTANPVRQPTWAYKWDLVSEVASEVNLLYKQYTNEMDSLTPEQVEWEPYGVGPNFGDAHTFELNPLCPHPLEWVDTDTQLHRLDRRRQRKIRIDRSIIRAMSLCSSKVCRLLRAYDEPSTRQHCPLAFNNYVRWFQESTRVEICLSAYEEDILEEPTEYDALAQGRYNKLIREGYQTSFAPVLNFVVSVLTYVKYEF